MGNSSLSHFPVQGVECLSVCKRPATAAIATEGKWTYVVGDLDAAEHMDDLLVALKAYAAAPNGVTPWKDRPPCFNRGVVS